MRTIFLTALAASMLCVFAPVGWAPALGAVEAASTAPELFVYEGAGCTGLANLPQFRAFVGRQEDGVLDFDDYRSTWANAVSELRWALGCWAGKVKNIAIAAPLSVNTYTPAPGSTQLADIAAGRMDGEFRTIGTELVAHGFARAIIRLGWEENGGWYPWRAGQNEAQWRAAFAHAYKVLKATPGSRFTILFNPSQGWLATQQSDDFPGLDVVDGIGWDVYANSWLSQGAVTEPGLWTNQYASSWGVDAVGSFYSQLPAAAPEFGVGSRGDGHGAPDGMVANGGDDPFFMAKALAYFVRQKVRFVGYWDYNAGDYNSKISDGSRPKEALAFLDVFGAPRQAAIFAVHAAPFTAEPAPKLSCVQCQAVAFQNGPGHWAIVIWSTTGQRSAKLSWGTAHDADLYDPAVSAEPVKPLAPASPADLTLTPDKPLIVVIQR